MHDSGSLDNIILIVGLPGSGKTTLASSIHKALIGSKWFNGDIIRETYNDFDFSVSGRLRQAERLKTLAHEAVDGGFNCIVDFVCPYNTIQDSFGADIFVWMNTIDRGRFEDTNKIFENPHTHNKDRICIHSSDWWTPESVNHWTNHIIVKIKS